MIIPVKGASLEVENTGKQCCIREVIYGRFEDLKWKKVKALLHWEKIFFCVWNLWVMTNNVTDL